MFASDTTPALVVRISLTITSEDLTQPISANFVHGALGWTATVSGIPPGNGRVFHAEAYDTTGATRYEGEATGVQIRADAVTAVAITLENPRQQGGSAEPVIDSLSATPLQVETGGTVVLQVVAHDELPSATLGYRWTATAGYFSPGDTARTLWTAPQMTGRQTLIIRVLDSAGQSVTASINVVVVPANTGLFLVRATLH